MNAYRNRVWLSSKRLNAMPYTQFLAEFGQLWGRMSSYERLRMIGTVR